MMKILIDSNSLQAQAHAQDGKRLATFLDLLRAIPGSDVAFSPPGPLTAADLSEQAALLILTRKGEHASAPLRPGWRDWARRPKAAFRRLTTPLAARPYASAELAAIGDFVRQGGGLLLLSNHGDLPRVSPVDMTQQDAILARQFGVRLENSFFAHPDPALLVSFSGPDLLASHPIMQGAAGESGVQSVVTRNCSSLVGPTAVPLIRLNQGMQDRRNGFAPQTRLFAAALENKAEVGDGRVLIMTDSGFIGAAGTSFPGEGLIDQGDNRRFIANAIRWLGRAL